ncbi:MAG: Na/Pi cotransporter family protein [Clostridia bacterium]|nr:Na/Pi cotransporter family protein [Clostridia bacterium]
MAILSQIDILRLILGLVFFLYGMHVMSTNLEKMAGGKLEQLLKKATANPIVSLLLGAAITIAVQSSSAVTVMLVGLVNSGIMQFGQTIGVIFGANIGTTLTAWILSLSGLENDNFILQMMKPENFSPIIALIGILMLMGSKSDKKKSVGTIFVGFAVLMYGMDFMKDAVSGLADIPEFSDMLVSFNNPVVGVVVGTLFTALIQSSAASVAILQALSATGAITYGIAAPIVMGQNIGTCVTSMISSIGTNANAKRVACIHLSVNVIGTGFIMVVYGLANAFFELTFLSVSVQPWSIALIHTIFNVVITILLMPFSKWIIRLAEVMVKEKASAQGQPQQAMLLDERLLRSPSVAIQECDNYTSTMAALADQTILSAISLLDCHDEAVVREVLKNEDKLDNYEDQLGTYLVKLSSQALSKADSRRVSRMLHAISDFERMGDHAVNLMNAAEEIHKKGIRFSEEAQSELVVMTSAIGEILRISATAYVNNDLELAARVEPLEEVIDGLADTIKDNHIRRLQEGRCSIELGFILMDILNNYERISDHCSNVAVAILELAHDSFDTHQYLNGMKFQNEDFNTQFNAFAKKYALASHTRL